MLHLSQSRRTARSILIAAAACLAIPVASANADIPITSFKAGPVAPFSNTSGFPLALGTAGPGNQNDMGCLHLNPAGPTLTPQAGATTDYCVTFLASPGNPVTGEDIKNTLVELPVGTVAEVEHQVKCTEAGFAENSPALQTCPGESQVGTAVAQLNTPAGTKQAPGRIYALEAPADKAAKFGVALLASAPSPSAPTDPYAESKFTITVSQEGTPTIGLLNQTSDLKQTVPNAALNAFGGAPIAIEANSLRFWGVAASHVHLTNPFVAPVAPVKMAGNFFRVGTTCATDQTTKITINPYTTPTTAYPAMVFGPTAVPSVDRSNSKPTNAEATYKLTGCENLAFNPTFSAALTGETTPGGHPGLNININNPDNNEDLGTTTITLPLGVATDLSRIQVQCPKATFDAGNCGDDTAIGTVSATLTGETGTFSGKVHMVKVAGETLPGLGLDIKGRLPLRLSGVSKIDSAGRIVNTFANIPSIPQRTLSIALVGGAKGILQIDPSGNCTASAFNATLIGQNGKAKIVAQPTVCGANFKATLAKSDTRRPTLNFSGVGATGKKIQSIRLTLPKGLTINRNRIRSGSKIDRLELTVKGRTTRSRLKKNAVRFSIPKPGSNGLRILTRTNTLGASKKFAKRETAINVVARVIYTDGTKVNVTVPIKRK